MAKIKLQKSWFDGARLRKRGIHEYNGDPELLPSDAEFLDKDDPRQAAVEEEAPVKTKTDLKSPQSDGDPPEKKDVQSNESLTPKSVKEAQKKDEPSKEPLFKEPDKKTK